MAVVKYAYSESTGGTSMEKRAYTAANETNHALAAALKELMAQKPLNKITIHDLTECCGIRRQNFYYHFEDVYGLLRWTFEEEALSLLEQHEGALLWQEGLLQLFRYLEENRAFCLCALRSLGRDALKQFFQADIHAVIYRTVEQIGREIGALNPDGPPADIDMVTEFYVIALAGVMESWLLGEIHRTPEELIDFVSQILQDHIRGAKLRFSGDHTAP